MFRNSKAVSSFSVNDIKKAKDFYGNILGLDVSEEMDGNILYVKIAGDNGLWIYEKHDHIPATYTVLNFPVSNIEETIEKLAKKGVKLEHYKGKMRTDEKGIFSDGGLKMAWFKDPAGNILAILEE